MKKVKKYLFVGTILIVFAILISVVLHHAEQIAEFFSEKYYYETKIKLDASEGLTTNKRIKDFNNVCNYIEKTVPFLYEYEELYGIKYEDVKDYFKECIENSETDYEYYAYLQGFFNNIPSGHMSLGYPGVENMNFMLSYFANKNKTFIDAQEYWIDTIHNECKNHYEDNENIVLFYYIGGEYLGTANMNEENKYNTINAKILTINGIDADEFVKICPSSEKIKYDHINQKVCRALLMFNDCYGMECNVKYQGDDGEIYETKLYYGTVSDLILYSKDYYYALDNELIDSYSSTDTIQSEDIDFLAEEIDIGSVYARKDFDNNILYINISDFEANSRFVAEIISKSSENLDNIIIDIRENQGGYTPHVNSALSQISTVNIEINDYVYITKSKSQELYYKDNDEISFSKEHSFGNLKAISRSSFIEGQCKEKKNIYVLVSDKTLSAADRFASIVKDNNLGTVIGSNNTQGERYGSPDLFLFEESGLYICYTGFKYYNKDGTDNSVYGTEPDIYVNKSAENYMKMQDMILAGENVRSYENRLKLDDVLIKTLEIINEKENAK